MKTRVSKQEALCFLLTYIVIERGHVLNLNPMVLFELTNLADDAVNRINAATGFIPHEVIEELANQYLEKQ